MKIFKKTLALLICFCFVNTSLAGDYAKSNLSDSLSNTLKLMILNDLFSINELYNGCLLQEKQFYLNSDSIVVPYTVYDQAFQVNKDFIKINSIRQSGSYIEVEVSFNVLFNSMIRFYQPSMFKYIVYLREGKVLKVNGFLTSELFQVNSINNLSVLIGKKEKELVKAFISRDISYFEKLFQVSVLTSLFNEPTHPFLIKSICDTGI